MKCDEPFGVVAARVGGVLQRNRGNVCVFREREGPMQGRQPVLGHDDDDHRPVGAESRERAGDVFAGEPVFETDRSCAGRERSHARGPRVHPRQRRPQCVGEEQRALEEWPVLAERKGAAAHGRTDREEFAEHQPIARRVAEHLGRQACRRPRLAARV